MHDFKIKIVSFITYTGTEMTTEDNLEVYTYKMMLYECQWDNMSTNEEREAVSVVSLVSIQMDILIRPSPKSLDF